MKYHIQKEEAAPSEASLAASSAAYSAASSAAAAETATAAAIASASASATADAANSAAKAVRALAECVVKSTETTKNLASLAALDNAESISFATAKAIRTAADIVTAAVKSTQADTINFEVPFTEHSQLEAGSIEKQVAGIVARSGKITADVLANALKVAPDGIAKINADAGDVSASRGRLSIESAAEVSIVAAE